MFIIMNAEYKQKNAEVFSPPLMHWLQILFPIHTSRNETTIRTSVGAKLLAGTMNR